MTYVCQIVQCSLPTVTKIKYSAQDTGFEGVLFVCELHERLIKAWDSIYREIEQQGSNVAHALQARDQILLYLRYGCSVQRRVVDVRNACVTDQLGYLQMQEQKLCNYANCKHAATSLMPAWKEDATHFQPWLTFCFVHARLMSEIYFRYKWIEEKYHVMSLTTKVNPKTALYEAEALASVIADRWKFHATLRSCEYESDYRKLMNYLILLYSKRIKRLIALGCYLPICCLNCQCRMQTMQSANNSSFVGTWSNEENRSKEVKES